MPGQVIQLVFDGVADGPVGIGLDILAAAARLTPGGAGLRSRLASLDGAPVRTATGRALAVDGALRLGGLGRGDALVLPGLGLATPDAIASGLERSDLVRGQARVARAAARGVWVAASCSATFVLAAAGLLDGREATTTWWLGPTFAQRFPRVSLCTDRMVVRSGSVFTAGSSFAHADLMLALVAQLGSPTLAHRVAQYLVLDERASQSRYMVAGHLQSADPVVRALERYVNAHLEEPLEVAQLARATATSPRTLARRLAQALGTTPRRFVQRLRVARAAHLLDSTKRSVDDIAGQVGYADAAAFRRVFRRETGEPPSARRSRQR
jgi:transcriptional regulator GlxA family with amidase domain